MLGDQRYVGAMKHTPHSRSSATTRSKPFTVRLEPVPRSERAAYVESVCEVLLESRCGPLYSYSCIDRPDHGAADEPLDALELIGEEFLPAYAMEYLGRALQGRARSKAGSPSDTGSGENVAALVSDDLDRSSANFGRGSPTPTDAFLTSRCLSISSRT